ncbi:MAG: FtsK/SpoIIIE domain-containing protein [Planctomycetaceae bacterium]
MSTQLLESSPPVATMFAGSPSFDMEEELSLTLDSFRQSDCLPIHQCFAGMSDYQTLLAQLRQAVRRRAQQEVEHAERFPTGADDTETQLTRQLEQISDERELRLEELSNEFERRRSELTQRHAELLDTAQYAHREALRGIERSHNEQRDQVEERYRESTWVTSSVLDDSSDDSPKRKFEKFKSNLLKAREDQISQFETLEARLIERAEAAGWSGPPPVEPANPPKDRDAAQERFQATVERATEQESVHDRQWLPRLFIGLRGVWLFCLLTAVFFAPIFLLTPLELVRIRAERMSGPWSGIALGVAASLALVIEILLYSIASMRRSDALRNLQQSVAEARWVHHKWLGMAKEELQHRTKEFESLQRDVVAQREEAFERYQSAHAERLEQIENSREQQQRHETERLERLRQQLDAEREQAFAALDSEQQSQLRTESQAFEAASNRLQQELSQYTGVRRREQAQHWQSLKQEWQATLSNFYNASSAARAASDATCPTWETLLNHWAPAQTIPDGVRLGDYCVEFDRIPQAISSDPRLAPAKTSELLPALVPFPNASSLLFEFRGVEGRASAIAAQQTMLLRLLTQLPPGTIRLTVLDPVGLGESFAGFMHLADFDEKLIASRIWTEASQIEARLADLTEHMENVFQKYLRNEFATIEEYNRHAGEVAEPYHFLVISDFPAKFSDIAARRLTSIITSGPRCGVYTLLSVDQSLPNPNNFLLDDLREQMQSLTWRGDAFHPTAGDLSDWPVVIDAPPPPEQFTRLVRKVGEASKDARRVEVAFSRVAPSSSDYWTHDSRREIDVPLGRAGATKLQHLRLGKGTSQHMLVAGKTGSGKSTYLHGLITNVALHYSPDEVRFYLIDFKKGVEFKDYAAFRLPHADVIAIESDREFGVSTLGRLDEVLQERGELFRRHGVQDIAGFRDANPDRPLPRILLVVDEFQEFFVEDDRLSQTASLLLDRLVRQGRAFGMHVVLGSQTLGGAYSLARSTLGQVAVRVALQCSDADAHLILSEENTAARLLSRPGEAIYNDANGLLVGNHPFQVAYLPDNERENYLRELTTKARTLGKNWPAPVVFEGNIPSDPARNDELARLLAPSSSDSAPKSKPAPKVWLGEAVEIGEPTSLTFHRQAGSHLLLVGTDAEAAYGVMATSMVALAGQAARFAFQQQDAALPVSVYLFDGTPPDSIEAEWWETLCDALPAKVERVTPRRAAEVLQQLAAEKARRDADPDGQHPPLFVFVHNLSKFRDLRKAEDEFSFGGFGSSQTDKPVSPGQTFADLIATGPELGIHFILWCDTAANVDRWLSRNSLKELEQRVLFQMNGADSSNLIDSPAAAKLGVHRAIVYREESGSSEKFRPYGPPSIAWLRELTRQRSSHQPPLTTPSNSPSTVTAQPASTAALLGKTSRNRSRKPPTWTSSWSHERQHRRCGSNRAEAQWSQRYPPSAPGMTWTRSRKRTTSSDNSSRVTRLTVAAP